jgi:uncharacterized protein
MPKVTLDNIGMTTSHDLNDAEIGTLDDLLAATPEPLQALDASMLDGYLCGVLVQPQLLELEDWLPPIFDYDGGALPDDVDVAWLDQATALIKRRHEALRQGLAEHGWFDPIVLDAEDAGDPEPLPDDATDEERAQRAAYESLTPISRSLMPWVAGFQHAALCFPELAELPDPAVDAALARLYRHLPAETPEEKEVVATLDREQPLKDLDAAIEELVVTVADLHDLTEKQRYKVETIRHDGPKVGRNDPCPCGSGKKYKACHGKS